MWKKELWPELCALVGREVPKDVENAILYVQRFANGLTISLTVDRLSHSKKSFDYVVRVVRGKNYYLWSKIDNFENYQKLLTKNVRFVSLLENPSLIFLGQIFLGLQGQ